MRLVLDWDGTVTERDTLVAVIMRFGDRGVFEHVEREVRNGMSQHEVIAREVETIDATLEEMIGYLLETVSVRPGFHELAERFHPTIVSAGFHELIEPLLAREGVELDVRRTGSTGRRPAGARASPTRASALSAVRRASAPRCSTAARR